MVNSNLFNYSLDSSIECGLHDKQAETGIRMAYDLMVTDKQYDTLMVDPPYMELDEIRIAFGPYIFGLVMAIIAFCGEYYFQDIINLTQNYL